MDQVKNITVPKKKQNRYFDESKGSDTTSQLGNTKQTKNFDGETIEVQNREKYFRKPLPARKKKRRGTIDTDAIARYSRGRAIGESGVKTNFFKDKLKRKEVYIQFSNEQAARTEILRNEEEGYANITYFSTLIINKILNLVILYQKKGKLQ